ncbi:MAG: XdhC family protein [Spirochaetota bacterium]|nr:MAG: XdhC family protein [Spirochaetota bacterium]
MPEIFEAVLNLRQSGEAGVLVTIVDTAGSSPLDAGAKLLLTSQGVVTGTVGGGALESEAIETAKKVLNNKKSLLQKYSMGEHGTSLDAVELGMICGGSATLFYEYIGATDHVFIFGAGHVGKALLYHLKTRGVLITIIDSRKDILEGIEGAEKVHAPDYTDFPKSLTVPDGSYIIIANHSHDLDYEALKYIYSSAWNPSYVGVIASRRKAGTMVSKLRKEIGKSVDLKNLYTPVGLDLGGRSVDEIAISIISELQGLKYGKTNLNHMKNREERK